MSQFDSGYGSQMYQVYLDDMMFPVAPSKIEWKYNGENETFSLINQGEITVIRPLQLTDFSFQALLPHQRYPFAHYPNGNFLPESYYLQRLKEMMEARKPVEFMILRPGRTYDNKLEKVTLENYTVQENAEDGQDIVVDIQLRQYQDYGTVTYYPGAGGSGQVQTERSDGEHTVPSEEQPLQYTVQSGDSLWTICQRQYGDGSKCWDIAQRNGISNPNVIYAGQVIVLD